MNIDDIKKEAIKRINKLGYENQKLKQQNDALIKQKTILETALNNSKTETAVEIQKSYHYQKIIAGQKKKIIEDGIVETEEEILFELPNNLHKVEKINVVVDRKIPKQ
jgi:hypothetical protein